MMVGAREARLAPKTVGVRPERENGVVERGGSEPTAVVGEMAWWGLGLRAAAAFSSMEDRLRLSCSEGISLVLAVLLFVPVCGFSPTTVP